MSKFVDALMKFRETLFAEYGPKAEVFKIGISPELLDAVKSEFARERYYTTGDNRIDGINVCGTNVVAAPKDRFVK